MAQDPLFPISPAELMKELIRTKTDAGIVPHVVVGPLSEEQQREGGLSIVTAGTAAEELYLPLIRPRIQIRCVGGSLGKSELMARHVAMKIDGLGRSEVTQPSTGDRYLIHWVNVTGGPSDHFDTAETFEGLMFADTMMGTTPIPSS